MSVWSIFVSVNLIICVIIGEEFFFSFFFFFFLANSPELRQTQNLQEGSFQSHCKSCWGPFKGLIKVPNCIKNMKMGKIPQGYRGAIYCPGHTKKSKKFSISFDYFLWLQEPELYVRAYIYTRISVSTLPDSNTPLALRGGLVYGPYEWCRCSFHQKKTKWSDQI